MYFEVYKQGNLIRRGRGQLGTLEFSNELMFEPSCMLTLPIEWLECFDGREEVKIFVNGKVLWGIVWDIEVDKINEIITLDVRHVVSEWRYRQISVNHAMANENLNIVYKGDTVVTSDDNDETITANNFSVMAKKIAKMSTADWVAKASAVAWVTSNGDNVKVTKADVSKVEKKSGTYKVTFSTAKGTSVTVDCNVVSNVEYQNQKTKTDKANKETIAATPFKVALEEAQNLSASDIIKMSKPSAWVYRHKNQSVTVTSTSTTFAQAAGEYTVTASTAKGTSITVTITVTDEDGSYSNVSDPAVVDKIEDIYNDMNFAYPGWQIDFQSGGDKVIDYVYSRQNKLDALTQTMELTDDLFWRVGLINEKKIEIGTFGEIKPYVISKKPSGETNIRLIEEPVIDYDFENVVNVATVYSDKSDSGMSSLTLREVYMNPSKQKKGFPVVILHANVNNERDYSRYISQYPKLAPNNEIEYAVLDEESIALESGTVIEGTYAFNDMSPFELDGKQVSDDKRIKAAETVYERVIKRLIQSRRSYNIEIATEPIPSDLNVGDKVRVLYDNSIWENVECSSYWRKILAMDDYYYITAISYEIDEVGNEIDRLTLSKWLRIERDTNNYD